jgi:NAD(P)H-nitrite reductase large subunit
LRERSIVVCRCREVTLAEIEAAIDEGADSLQAIKRWTTAGAGLCQGRTCGHLVRTILCEIVGLDAATVGRDTVRPPLEPLRLSVFLSGDDSDESP